MKSYFRGKKFWIIQLAKLVLGAILIYVMLRWFEHKQVYIPSLRVDRSGELLERPWEDVYFQVSDGTTLNGWYFPCDEKSRCPNVAVLLCHGNAGNISHRFGNYAVLLEAGLNVFAFDYRGYGRSHGVPSEEGTYSDAVAAYNWLVEKGFEKTRIIGLGESLGGGIVSELAIRVPLGGIIVQSSFTSIPDLGAELFPWLPVRWLSTIRYDTLGKLPEIHVPVMIMHSREDSLIGFGHAEKNYAAANDPKRLWELVGDHNDTLATNAESYGNGITEFLVLSGLLQ